MVPSKISVPTRLAPTTRPPCQNSKLESSPLPLKKVRVQDAWAQAIRTRSIDSLPPSWLTVLRWYLLRWSRYAGIAATGLAGFMVALATWEGILQLSVESRRGAAEHAVLGRIEKPGFMLNSREGFSRTRLNSLGMRSPEPTPKQPGDYRILILGDSFTRGDEVADGQNFSDRLQTALQTSLSARKSEKVSDLSQTTGAATSDSAASETTESAMASEQPSQIQVINAGKPSASPASYLYAADFHKQTFAPDSTVIQLTDSDFTLDMNNPISEFYVTRQAADSQADDSQKSTEDYQIIRNENFGSVDPLAQKVMQYAPLRSLLQMSALRVGGRNLQASLSPPANAAESISAEDEELQKLAAEDAALASWTLDQLNQQFPNLVLVFIPAMNYQDAGEVSSEPRNAALESALERAATQKGIPFLNMRSDFLAHYRTHRTHLKGFNNTVPGQGHLNPKGHELVAEKLAKFYEENMDSL